MTKFTLDEVDEIIAVEMAQKEGKTIEYKPKDGVIWTEKINPLWDWTRFNYRIKPETMTEIVKPRIVLKPFNIELAKKGFPVCTRDEHDVRIICYDLIGGIRPIVALVMFTESELLEYYTIDGENDDYDMDLFMKETLPAPSSESNPQFEEYRPFKSIEEVIKAVEKHGEWVHKKSHIEKFYSKNISIDFNDQVVNFGNGYYSLEEVVHKFEFCKDKTPFGVKEETV